MNKKHIKTTIFIEQASMRNINYHLMSRDKKEWPSTRQHSFAFVLYLPLPHSVPCRKKLLGTSFQTVWHLLLCPRACWKSVHSCELCVSVCVCEGVGWGGMQVNSLRGPTAPRASLAHHLTAIPDEGLRTNELIKQMSEQASVGVDRRRRPTQGGVLWLRLNLRTSAISACRPELGVSSLVRGRLPKELTVFLSCPIRLPQAPAAHLHPCNSIVLLGWKSFSFDLY